MKWNFYRVVRSILHRPHGLSIKIWLVKLNVFSETNCPIISPIIGVDAFALADCTLYPMFGGGGRMDSLQDMSKIFSTAPHPSRLPDHHFAGICSRKEKRRDGLGKRLKMAHDSAAKIYPFLPLSLPPDPPWNFPCPLYLHLCMGCKASLGSTCIFAPPYTHQAFWGPNGFNGKYGTDKNVCALSALAIWLERKRRF